MRSPALPRLSRLRSRVSSACGSCGFGGKPASSTQLPLPVDDPELVGLEQPPIGPLRTEHPLLPDQVVEDRLRRIRHDVPAHAVLRSSAVAAVPNANAVARAAAARRRRSRLRLRDASASSCVGSPFSEGLAAHCPPAARRRTLIGGTVSSSSRGGIPSYADRSRRGRMPPGRLGTAQVPLHHSHCGVERHTRYFGTRLEGSGSRDGSVERKPRSRGGPFDGND